MKTYKNKPIEPELFVWTFQRATSIQEVSDTLEIPPKNVRSKAASYKLGYVIELKYLPPGDPSGRLKNNPNKVDSVKLNRLAKYSYKECP